MAVELAAAYVSLIPSTRGLSGQLKKEFGGPLESVAAAAGLNAGRGFGANLAANAVRGLDRLGGSIVSTITTGMKIGAATGVAALGTALTLGFQRLRAIDDARAKLRGLGHDAAGVEAIMNSALASVKGTSFGLGDAATIAASAVAAGIKPGEALTRTLKLTGDAAAIAGVPLSEMGSIFNKVATGNRATMMEINQLSDRGIPIIQWLAAEYGVTAEAARDMVTRGKVDFETFQKAIEDNIGGAALTMGDSWSGAFSNMLAAAGRLGAGLIGPIFEQSKGFFTGTIGFLDNLTERAAPMGRTIGNALERFSLGLRGVAGELDPITGQVLRSSDGVHAFGLKVRGAFEMVAGAVQSAIGWFRENEATVKRLAAAVGPAVGIIGALATSVHLAGRMLKILGLSTPVGIIMALVAALVYAWQNSETFRNIVTGAFEYVRGVVERVTSLFSGGGGLSGAMERARDIADRVFGAFREGGAVFEWFSSLWQSLKPRIDAIGASFDGIWQTLKPVVQWIGERLPGAFQTLWSIVQPIVSFIVTLIGDTLRMAIDGVVQAFQGAVSIIEGVLNVFAGLFTGDWSRMWEGVKQIFQGVWNAIVGIVKVYLAGTVLKLISAPLKAITQLWQSTWNGIRSFFQNIWKALVNVVKGGSDQAVGVVRGGMNLIRTVIRTVWNAVRDFVRTIQNAIRDVIRNVWNSIRDTIRTVANAARDAVRTAFNAMRDAVRNAVNAARDTVRNVFNTIRDTMRNVSNSARDLVRNAFNSMRDGVRNTLNSLVDTVRGIPGRIVSALGNVGRLLYDAGRKIIEGLIGGITAMAGRVKDAVKGVLDGARRLLPFSPAKEGPFSGKGWTLYAGRSIVEGLAQGIGQRQKLVTASMHQLAAQAQRELQPTLDTLPTIPTGRYRATSTMYAPAAASAPLHLSGQVKLQVGDREMDAYIDGRLDEAGRGMLQASRSR